MANNQGESKHSAFAAEQAAQRGDHAIYYPELSDGIAYEIKAGDVVVIPTGTGHWFTRTEDHIDYLMVRIDPDKVTPLKSEAQSQEYLSKPAARGE